MTTCTTNRCKQGRVPCPTPLSCGLMTQEGGISVHFEPPVREIRRFPKQYEPDYEIEHTKVSYRPTPLAYCLAIFAVVMFVISVFRHV